MPVSIVDAIHDPNLFRPFLADKKGCIDSWTTWIAALRAIHGLPLEPQDRDLVRECSGRDPDELPDGCTTALLLCGRRSGKSRMAAVLAAYEACLAGHQERLAPGELGMVPVVAPTKAQGRIVAGYLRAVFGTKLLKGQVVKEDSDGFTLRGGTRIEIMAGNFRSVRGYTMLAAVVDEICFFHDREAKVSDVELIRALKPGLATTGGRLVCISSPWARKGWAYQQWRKHHGNNSSRTMVWQAASLRMNPTLNPQVVADARADDPAAARSEWDGLFRDDVTGFLDRTVVESCVDEGVTRRSVQFGVQYYAGADLSGGRGDAAALAVAHKDGGKVVLDYLQVWPAPHNPHEVLGEVSRVLDCYHVDRMTGDKYAAEWVVSACRDVGITYRASKLNRSELYLNLLPLITTQTAALLDDDLLLSQLAALERRTRTGGRDTVDHPPGGHDDAANAAAIALNLATGKVGKRRAGVFTGRENLIPNGRLELLRQVRKQRRYA